MTLSPSLFNHYRETIADMLQGFDNYSCSCSFYKDLAWEGLMSNDEYTNVAWEAESDAEQQTMAEYYIGFIADGLKEYDNSQLSRAHYEAIAWDGLIETKAWEDNPNKGEISQYRYDDKIDNRPQQCSR